MFLIDKKISVDKPSTSRTITKYDMCYYNLLQLGLLQITATCYYKLGWLGYYNSPWQLLLQFTTIAIIIIYDRYYNSRQNSRTCA